MVLVKSKPLRGLSSKELRHFKLLVVFVFLVYGLFLPIWFIFHGHTYLHATEQWTDIVSSKTRPPHSQHVAELKIISKNNEHSIHKIPKKNTSNYSIESPSPPRRFSRAKARLLSMKWDNICCQSINCLRKYPLFPLLPSKTSYFRNLRVFDSGKLFAQRITGLLAPPKSGNYSFMMKCAATCEMWFGKNRYPLSSKLALKVVRDVPQNHVLPENNPGRLKRTFNAELSSSKKYFIDIIFNVYRSLSRPLEIFWKLPNASDYILVTKPFLEGFPEKRVSLRTVLKVLARAPSVHLTPFLESIEEKGEDDEDFVTVGNQPQSNNNTFINASGKIIAIDRTLDLSGPLSLSQYKSHKFVQPSMKTCSNRQTFSVNGSVAGPRYAGVWRTSFTSVFPRDDTGRMMCIGNRYPMDCQGNWEIPSETVQKLLNLYTKLLAGKSNKGLKVGSVVNIEQKTDRLNGSRFLLDSVLVDPRSNETFSRSEYLYMKKEGTSICFPAGFLVDLSKTVNVIVVSKNQPRWLSHFLTNMERIYDKTKDEKLNIIIAKYGKKEGKLMDEYMRTRLPSIRMVRQFGVFHKTKAIQSAVDTIQDANSIIFLMDLHMLVPDAMMSLVRKHTIKGRMVFNPVVFRLSHCGSPGTLARAPRGFWETFGYGVLGIYKSDWNRIGGMSTKKSNHGWGGEDWELLDRILTSGLEVERLRVPGFYHFYHARKNMWN